MDKSVDESQRTDGGIEIQNVGGQFSKWLPNYVLIVLDSHEAMFVQDEMGTSPFTNCIKACYNIVDKMILSTKSPKSPLGLIITCDDESKSTVVDFEHSVPSAYKVLKKLSNSPNPALKEEYTSKIDVNLAALFLECKKKIKQIHGAAYKRVIVYVTNRDDPVGSDSLKKFNVMKEVETLKSLGVSLEIVTMNPNFNAECFYSELLRTSQSADVVSLAEDFIGLKIMLSTYFIPSYTQHKAKFYPVKTRQDKYFEVVVKNCVKKAKVSANVHVTKNTHSRVKKLKVKTVKERMCNFKYSKKKPFLKVTKPQANKMLENDLALGYTLLCTSSALSEYGEILKRPTLMQHYEKETCVLFDAFWSYCASKNKVLICAQKSKLGGSVKLVELSAKLINNIRTFMVKVLPQSDNFTQILSKPNTTKEKVATKERVTTDEQRQAMEKLVTALTIDYKVGDSINLNYRKQKAYLKSQILGEDVEKVEDTTVTNKQLDETISEQAAQINKLFISVRQGIKRPQAEGTSSKRKK